MVLPKAEDVVISENPFIQNHPQLNLLRLRSWRRGSRPLAGTRSDGTESCSPGRTNQPGLDLLNPRSNLRPERGAAGDGVDASFFGDRGAGINIL
jgi:hypothetical protein